MRLLLDTHILLAIVEHGSVGRPEHVAAFLGDQRNEHHLSAASLWEIAIKVRLGKLRLTPSLAALPELVDGVGITIVAINERHAVASVDPEPATRDPFDRMLLAQCQVEGLRLLTIDRSLISNPMAANG
jgi:PIN domain nuclease of toxin-antitoxin system